MSATNNRSATVKVGLLAVVSIVLLVFVLVWIRGRGINPGTQYTVLFKDVDGMREGAPVQMMGIRIGFVDAVSPVELNDKYFVRVAFNVNHPDVEVPKGSRLSIEQSGIIGEKFLEITPPQLRSVMLTTLSEPAASITPGIPVRYVYEDGVLDVGMVENVEQTPDENLVRHNLYFRITRPGTELPKHPVYELKLDENGLFYLLILPRDGLLTQSPDKELVFTVENPVRIKEFLEIQLESAEALRDTNEKITQLLSDENIATLSSTVKNTEVLTARATEVLDSANALFKMASKDMETLVDTSEHLAKNLVAVSDNLNEVIGDPQLKQDILSTIASVEESTHALSEVLKDPALKETMTMARDTTHDANELVALLKKTAQDRELQDRLDRSLTLLNSSLDRLSNVMSSVDEITSDKDQTLKGILRDTKETTTNLKQFSKKLNGRFSLIRLLF